MGLRAMIRVVLPSTALLHTKTTPLCVTQRTRLGQILSGVLRKYHMPVLKFAILVLLTIFNLWIDRGRL